MATRISLLGGFSVEVDGAVIPEAAWRLRKSRSVLKLLALTPGRALHPERLQALLWPDREAAAAGNNLRQAVYQARRALSGAGADGSALLALRGDLLALSDTVEVDVDSFERAAARAERSGVAGEIEAAVQLYAGELLPEDAYEDWTSEPRRALAERYVALLLRLAETREPSSATDPLHRALAADALNESAHRALMRAYAASGRRAQALTHFEELRESLRRELGADPDPDTRALYRELLAAGAPRAVETAPAGPRHNLPSLPTSFIGRTRELDELRHTLPSHRLVTLTGPGGCGKTRLAVELAQQELESHADGAWFVELAAIADGRLVGQAAAAALGFDLRPDEAPDAGLAHHLADRELLLVIDNCEHVLDACARIVETVLARCPRVTVVTTSREPLHLPGEVDWRVPSLELLDTDAISDIDQLARSDAVRLFCDRAEAANPRFRLTLANAQAIAEICLGVDGLPLAIELAAARTAALSPAEIASRLREGLAVLRATRTGGLTRQQTLEGTLDWSHALLSPRERTLFRRLSVFAGGFELEAAEAITADDQLHRDDILELLAGLVDKSLVGVDDSEASYRYRLLEPVRQYAALRLSESGERDAQVARHADWFAELTGHSGGRVTDLDPGWVVRLERDHDNLRAAIGWLLDHKPARAVEAATGMAGLWLLRAHLREGCNWLDRALDASSERSEARAEALHARQALERRRPYNYDLADRLASERIDIYADAGDRRSTCLAILDLTDGALLRGSFDQGVALIERATAIATEIGDTGLLAVAHERAGLGAAWRLEFDKAREEFEAALELHDSNSSTEPNSAVISLSGFIDDARDLDRYPNARLEETSLHFRRLSSRAARASVLSHLAYVDRCAGDFDAARRHLDDALGVVTAHGNALDDARLRAQRGCLEGRAGELDAARGWLEQSLELRDGLRDHRGILLTAAALAIVEAAGGQDERAQSLLARAQRLANEAVDGPGMGGVMQARAEIERRRGDLAAACTSLDAALNVFYGVTGLTHYASWLQLQHAYLSLELGDGAETARRLRLAWRGFEESRTEAGMARCRYLGERLQAANGLLTAGRWSPPHTSDPRRANDRNTTN